MRQRRYWLWLFGLLLLIPYGVAWWIQDLRAATVGFEIAFFIAFLLYAMVTLLVLRQPDLTHREIVFGFGLALLMQGLLFTTPPTLSDDMYRYVWEGRLQAHGFSPYRYPPDAPEVAHLRDEQIWPLVNRKSSITVYPPAAEFAYALLWRIWPDHVRWFQMAMAAGALLAGILLLGILRDLGQSSARLLIYLWSPLLIFETAHGAHIDGLVLPLLVAAWWARIREKDGQVALWLGLATAMKLFPLLLVPALWRPADRRGRWQFPLVFALTIAACYLPYLLWTGADVIGFLPHYFGERFNMGLAGWLIPWFRQIGIEPDLGINGLLFLSLVVIALWMFVNPAPDGATAVRRSIWLIGAFTLLTQNLFSWYMLWLLPLLALFIEPDKRTGLRINGWSGWWLFSGLIMLSYTFFIYWRPLPLALYAQFLPLYLLLLIDVGRSLQRRFSHGTHSDPTPTLPASRGGR